MLATLIRQLGDFDLAEEAVQEALAAALTAWERDPPRNPGAWLTTTARRKAIDRVRRTQTLARKQQALARLVEIDQVGAGEEYAVPSALTDDRLRLMFTCCHPALPMEARVALTLRTLGGLTTAEVARSFLVAEATMAQRLVRAKRKIRAAGIPYRVPEEAELAGRLPGVLAVLYLVFNAGYSAAAGDDLLRPDLTAEAIRLGRLLARLMPAEPEAAGLLALMLFHEARREARIDAAGDLVLLEDQDRSRWDRAQIDEATARLDAAWQLERRGPYQLQAAIAALHCTAAEAAATDWRQIAALYGELAAMAPSPVVELNRAVAVAMADGPAAGLPLMDGLGLDRYQHFHSARADLLRRLGDRAAAAAAYRRALALAEAPAERRFLERRLAEVAGQPRWGDDAAATHGARAIADVPEDAGPSRG